MKQYKAGDFTSGKMNQIFKEASGTYPSGVKINHKQLGDFSLVSHNGLNMLLNSILSNNFGIYNSEGKYVSCFGDIDESNNDLVFEANYFKGHIDNDAQSIMLSYEVMNWLKDMDRESIVSLIEITSLKASKLDDHFSLSITTNDKYMIDLFKTKDAASRALGLTCNLIESVFESFIIATDEDKFTGGTSFCMSKFAEASKYYAVDAFGDICSESFVLNMVENMEGLIDCALSTEYCYFKKSDCGKYIGFKTLTVDV